MTQHSDTPATGADETPTTGNGRLNRRTIVKSAAWSIPVIAGATAAPLAAASTTPCVGRAEVVSAGYIRDSSDGWLGELQSNASGARLGIGVVLPGSRMKSNVAYRNPTNCAWTGTVRIQIDLPVAILAANPSSEQGWAISNGGDYVRDGLTYRRFYFTGTLSLAAGATFQSGVNWTLNDLATLRTNLGATDTPQRWTQLPATSRSAGWRFTNPGGSIVIDGAVAQSGGYNNQLAQNAGFWIHANQVAA
ncbi:hypothetical protein [Rathayibacter tanaceti]|uniref:Uncharacterized protein n=2 Tax=Rathayibacter tanaceti TaxID=1671680 RepID=A0A162GJM1_9MICO|nr:hypothetical protein [Rathayibacter tanaceti]KZX22299.1 hypothetical protein ACH61_00540 [Rathayibacter tanaceti]QHC56124.1 hypothetical protein GSU10_11100 [Rathayibacter tanaceti]TCO36961.1 hypothetical protein EV639_10544 [Rathayibacter tanaceti]